MRKPQTNLNQDKREVVTIGEFSKRLFLSSSSSKTGLKKGQALNGQSGQVIVEYVLLLFIAIMAANLITKGLVSRNPDSPGVITSAWVKMNSAIGSDIID